MISYSTIWAIALRHIRVWRRDINLLLAGFYWPLLDILIWGFLGSWIQSTQPSQFHNYKATALLGILLWQIIGRGSNIMIFSLCEEFWSHNVVNLFSLPLRIVEWMCGILLFMAMVMFMTSAFCMSVIFLCYDVSIWHMITTFLLFLPPLFFCTIWIGFTALAIVVSSGKRGVELGFVMSWFLAPFSGAYYPIDILPQWAQKISAFLPMSYAFAGMRGFLMKNQDPVRYLAKSYALSILYASLAILLFVYCFNRAKQKGLARLVD